MRLVLLLFPLRLALEVLLVVFLKIVVSHNCELFRFIPRIYDAGFYSAIAGSTLLEACALECHRVAYLGNACRSTVGGCRRSYLGRYDDHLVIVAAGYAILLVTIHSIDE